MRQVIIFSLALAFVLSLAQVSSAGLVPGSSKYRTIHTEHFRLHYQSGYRDVAHRSAHILEEMHQALGREFNVYPKGKVEVVLTDQHDQANGFATVIPYNLMILRMVPPTAGSPLDYYGDWLRLLIAHEYTHVLNLSDAGYPAKILKFLLGKIVATNALSPTWITEGMATYYETAITGYGRGRSSYAEMIVRTDIIRDKFLPIDKAAGSMHDWPAWRAGYIYGVAFWNYLAETYGRDKIAQFSHKYGASLWFFSLNNKAKRVFGKYWYQLWRDWKGHLRQRYAKEIAAYRNSQRQQGRPLVTSKKGFYSAPAWNREGTELAYVSAAPDRATEVRIKSGNEDYVLFEKHGPAQMSWSPDGRYIAYTSRGINKRGYFYTDLYRYDMETQKAAALTKGRRARDAAYSPDGTRIAVSIHQKDGDRIGIYTIKTKKLSIKKPMPANRRIDHLDWSPRGIAASVARNGNRDIVVYNDLGQELRTISSGHSDLYPRWSPDGRYIYFSSDRSGFYNIYRYEWATRRTAMVTETLTGAFSAAPQPNSQQLTFQYYTGDGYELRDATAQPIAHPLNSIFATKTKNTEPLIPATSASAPMSEDYDDRPYTPLSPALLPHYIRPNAAFLDEAIFLNAIIGSQDPLARHSWFGSVSYRTDADFAGFGVGYQYGRYAPKFFVGFADFAVNFGDIFGNGQDFFEERRRGYAGVRGALKGGHVLSAQYFFEDRSAETTIPAGAAFQPVLGRFAGMRFGYIWNQRKKYRAAISPRESYYVRATVDITNSIFGASNNMEQTIFATDTRQYVEMPWNKNHVLAFRQMFGVALGDTLTQGTFAVGGSLGESPIATTSNRTFTLRGLPLTTFLRDRALVFSAEYRMPLFSVQRGLGTYPFFLNQVSLALFADYGNAWNKGQTPGPRNFFDDFLLGVGAELRANFVLGYHLPIMGRLGYGFIVTNRNRVSAVTDPILGHSVRNGILILDFGTSF